MDKKDVGVKKPRLREQPRLFKDNPEGKPLTQEL